MWFGGVCVTEPVCFGILTQYVDGCIYVVNVSMYIHGMCVCVCVGIYVVSVVGVGRGGVGVWVHVE